MSVTKRLLTSGPWAEPSGFVAPVGLLKDLLSAYIYSIGRDTTSRRDRRRARVERQTIAPQAEDDSNAAALVALLGLGILIHKTHLPEPFESPWPIAVTLCCVAATWWPRSGVVVTLLATSLVVETLWSWPHLWNHPVYLLFVAGAVIAASVSRQASQPGTSTEGLEKEFWSVLRGGVYVLFFFAVLHKLNHGFIDTEGSCAIAHYGDLRDRFGFLPSPGGDPARIALITVTLLTEAAIPVLLFFRRSRVAGLCLAFVFHLIMGINGHQAFSGLTPAIYTPFLPTTLVADLKTWNARFTHVLGRGWPAWVIPLTGTALGLLGLIAGFTERYYRVRQIGLATFLVIYPLLFGVLLWQLRHGAHTWPTRNRGAQVRPVFAVLLSLLFLNGASPYLGLKTQMSFSMYSNLRTEGVEWNHLFVPSGLRFASYQDTLVTIAEVDREEVALSPLVRTGDRLVPSELRRALRVACTSGPIGIRLSIDGVSHVFENACDEFPLGGGKERLVEKLMWFRPLPVDNRCYH